MQSLHVKYALKHTLTIFPILGRGNCATVPERVVVLDELADILGSLSVDAFSCQQHVEQLEHGDDGMELDSLRSQHIHTALLSVH